MAKRREDLDLIMYRLDTIDKRIDTLERAVLSRGDSSSINTELLNIVLGMVRQQAQPQVVQHQESVVSSSASSVEAQQKAPVDCGSSFLFNRRKTVI